MSTSTGPQTRTWVWPDPEVTGPAAAVVEATPLVHCLTNIVVAGFSANVLLAAGASPAMVENASEAGPFASVAAAVLINMGTLTPEIERAMVAAAAAAGDAATPWVLDPVAVGALQHRSALAGELAGMGPAVIRGNASEIQALAGAGTGGRGVDSTAGSHEALDAAVALAGRTGSVVAVSGAVDLVTDGSQVIEVPGGDVLMTRVTGVGCALGALMAAFAGAGTPALEAAAAASAMLAAAGSRAAKGAPGPGTFAVRLLDEIAALAAAARR
ncbi:hydroxyethylthiazole kinase [Acidiferrimicrobium sp. IK]|uniref:hydroxyethylthiazole kinase n=1 Tax=Acidiferrimicrobium sp. IK TaxID=2871700 RepID=UPI0021CB0972|nr:hydroxyethylthiazole kinase [Acidiferrimicrobium sp. IK]MCU4186296.1 hydroxyethylthiazole kinase [Acidiferrimicrobium sp. IK]